MPIIFAQKTIKRGDAGGLTRAIDYIRRDKIILTTDAGIVEEYQEMKAINPNISINAGSTEFGNSFMITCPTLTSYINCTGDKTAEQFLMVNDMNSRGKLLAFPFTQSFQTVENQELINKIGVEFAERVFKGYQVIVSTHINTDNTHNHILVNSVSYENYKHLKYDDAFYRNMRKVSDEIALKYGFKIIEETKEYKLINYVDSKGKKHRYEPTERKNNMNGNKGYSKYSTNEYYSRVEAIHKNKVQYVQNLIDSQLEGCRNYNDLIIKLMALNCSVRYKKKNGEFLKYISYRPNGWDKAVRDDALGEGYSREELERRIQYLYTFQNKNNRRFISGSSFFYTADNVFMCNPEYANVSGENIERTENEKALLNTIHGYGNRVKHNGNELYFNYDNSQMTITAKMKYYDDNFTSMIKSLNYIEKHGVYSISQVSEKAKEIFANRLIVAENMQQVKKQIDRLENMSMLIKSYNMIKSGIDSNLASRVNEEYLAYDYEQDKMRLAYLESQLNKYDLKDTRKQEILEKSLDDFKRRYVMISTVMNDINNQLIELDEVMKGFNVCYKGIKNKEASFIKEYRAIKSAYTNKEMQKEQKEIKKKNIEKEVVL